MSNTNNPFLPHLTEGDNNKNENSNQNNNKAKNNNDTLNFLEEGDSSTAAPPPSYEDVVKPQPVLPGYNDHLYSYQSYPPPPAFPVSENYNQIPPHTAPARSNEKREHRVCCFRASRQNKNCGCGWIIVLMIFIIFGSISVANNNSCRNIRLSDIENFSTNISLSTLRINAENARMRTGEVRIFQGSQENGALVNIKVYTGSKGATPKYDTSTLNDVFELKISQADGFSIFNIPPRCMRTQINVYLPLDTSVITTNTIQVRNLDIKMVKNILPYQQNINLITVDGNIHLDDISSSAQSMNIKTKDGDVTGSIISSSNELSITTDDGDLKGLRLGIAAPNTNPKITAKTNDGDIALLFIPESPFSGSYDIQSNDGRIRVDNGNNPAIFRDHLTGRVGTGEATLNVKSDDGNILVVF